MTNLIRLTKVTEKTGCAKSTIWWMIANNKFPKQIKISPRISVWKESDVNEWIEKQIKLSEVV